MLENLSRDKKGFIATAESYSCGAPGDKEGTRRHRLCSNLLGPEAKQVGRELEAISSAGMRTSPTFLCVQLKNVDLKPICCKVIKERIYLERS